MSDSKIVTSHRIFVFGSSNEIRSLDTSTVISPTIPHSLARSVSSTVTMNFWLPENSYIRIMCCVLKRLNCNRVVGH